MTGNSFSEVAQVRNLGVLFDFLVFSMTKYRHSDVLLIFVSLTTLPRILFLCQSLFFFSTYMIFFLIFLFNLSFFNLPQFCFSSLQSSSSHNLLSKLNALLESNLIILLPFLEICWFLSATRRKSTIP